MTKSEAINAIDELPELKTVKQNGKQVQVITDLPASIKSAIDSFKEFDEKAKKFGELSNTNKQVVVEHASELQERYADQGQHSKSYRLVGNDKEVTFTRADKFSVGKESSFEDIEKATSKKFAKDHFEIVRTLQVHPEVMTSPTKLKKLVGVLQEALGDELSDFFVQDRKVVPKKGLDAAIYELPEDKRELLAKHVVQASGGLRG